MKTKIVVIEIFFLLVLLPIVSPFLICVDMITPSAPSNLNLVGFAEQIQLNWENAIDEPACSGIDYYNIYVSFNQGIFILIDTAVTTSYTHNISSLGTYNYMIKSVDNAGLEDINGISSKLIIEIRN